MLRSAINFNQVKMEFPTKGPTPHITHWEEVISLNAPNEEKVKELLYSIRNFIESLKYVDIKIEGLINKSVQRIEGVKTRNTEAYRRILREETIQLATELWRMCFNFELYTSLETEAAFERFFTEQVKNIHEN